MIEAVNRERRLLEETLASPWSDFIARFMAARSLRELFEARPGLADGESVSLLAGVLADPRILAERQGLFLFREAAGALRALFTAVPPSPLAEPAVTVLHGVLRHGHGAPQRATAETLAGLPLDLTPPRIDLPAERPLPVFSWAELTAGFELAGAPEFVGRSLVSRLATEPGFLVVKLARPADRPAELARETAWLGHLGALDLSLPAGFALPRPLGGLRSGTFRLGDLPLAPPVDLVLHPRCFAIAFTAPSGYYSYPNEPGPDAAAAARFLPTLLGDNARLLGALTGRGILHEAVIPLFHNRVQRERREDGGLYDWALGGRLDRWLESCRHPNFGASGLRDFEHLAPYEPRADLLYRQLGAHFLSLLLVAASFFRNREPDLRGLDGRGVPVDARHLFDPELLARLVETMFRNYHLGFAGVAAPAELPFDLDRLCGRMIDEMGVDRHMEEILRLADQEAMDDAAFVAFFRSRGLDNRQVARLVRGREDIVLHTGPHLGGFNQPISLPELVEAVGAMAAMCVLGRYRAEQGGAACCGRRPAGRRAGG